MAGKRLGKRLTKTEARKAVRKIEIEGQTVYSTMKGLGYSPVTANAMPSKLTRNPTYIEARNDLQKAILEHAPTYFKKLAVTAVAGLDAKKVSHFAFEGVVVDSKVDDDLVTRHKYLELGARLFGFLKDKEDAVTKIFNPSQFFILIQQSEGERPGLAQAEG